MIRHLFTLALLVFSTACAEAGRGDAKACDPCTWDGDCVDGFFCDTQMYTNGVPPPMVCKTAKMVAVRFACDVDCLGACQNSGRCLADNGTCKVRNSADCQQSNSCTVSGLCTACPVKAGSNELACKENCDE